MTTWVKRLIIANIALHVMVMTAPWLYNVLAFVPPPSITEEQLEAAVAVVEGVLEEAEA